MSAENSDQRSGFTVAPLRFPDGEVREIFGSKRIAGRKLISGAKHIEKSDLEREWFPNVAAEIVA